VSRVAVLQYQTIGSRAVCDGVVDLSCHQAICKSEDRQRHAAEEDCRSSTTGPGSEVCSDDLKLCRLKTGNQAALTNHRLRVSARYIRCAHRSEGQRQRAKRRSDSSCRIRKMSVGHSSSMRRAVVVMDPPVPLLQLLQLLQPVLLVLWLLWDP
jgi:hypothetical protein